MNTKFYNCISSFLFCLILVLGSNRHGIGQTLSVTGTNWTPSSPTVTTPGLDYNGTIETTTNYLTLSGNIPNGALISLLSGQTFKVQAQLVPTTWNSNLQLSVKRSNGTSTIGGICVLCNSEIVGGTEYVTIPNTGAINFFDITFAGTLGVGANINFSNISVQLKLSGLSVTIPSNSYSTKILFTVTSQ